MSAARKTTTLALALRVGKPHGDVMRAVASLRRDCKPELSEFFAEHFEEFQHTDPSGRRRRAYRLTRHGMVMTAGLLRNAKATAIVLKWIDDYNRLRALTGMEPE
jgi:phage regulator Rha-like protein